MCKSGRKWLRGQGHSLHQQTASFRRPRLVGELSTHKVPGWRIGLAIDERLAEIGLARMVRRVTSCTPPLV